MRNNHETTRQQNNKLPSEPTPNQNQTKQNQDTPPPWHMARISPILTESQKTAVKKGHLNVEKYTSLNQT